MRLFKFDIFNIYLIFQCRDNYGNAFYVGQYFVVVNIHILGQFMKMLSTSGGVFEPVDTWDTVSAIFKCKKRQKVQLCTVVYRL